MRSAQITLDGPPETHDRMRPLRERPPDVRRHPRQHRAVRRPPADRRTGQPRHLQRRRGRDACSTCSPSAGSVAGSPCTRAGSSPSTTARAPRARRTRRRASPCRSSPWSSGRSSRVRASWGSRPPSFRSRSARRARRCAPTSWSSARAASSTSAGTPSGNAREVIGHLRSWRDPNDRVLEVAALRPLHRRGLPLLHRPPDLHGRLRPSRDARPRRRLEVLDVPDDLPRAGRGVRRRRRGGEATGLRHALLPLTPV